MKSIKPQELPAHRAFFTEFDLHGDPSKWVTQSEKTMIALSIERKLKLLLLTKANILIAASQLLESPFAHSLLLKYPRLIESGAIVSSMKLGHESTSDFLETKRIEEETRKSNPYHRHEAQLVASLIDEKGTVVRWPLEVMSDWFRDRLAKDLIDDMSLIRIAMRREGILFPERVALTISSVKGLTRGKVDEIVSESGNTKLKNFVSLYAAFVYYLSGARATESEGILPQENLIDISLSDLIGAKTNLTENDIFFKVFIDTVKAKTSTIFPNEFLDAITIEDALDLRMVAASHEFVMQYNLLQKKTKDSIKTQDPEKLVLLLGELEEFETSLHKKFNAALDSELSSRLTETRQRAGGQFLHSLASIAIPGYGVDSYKELIVSALRWTGRKEIAEKIECKINKGIAACENLLEHRGLLEQQALLDFLDNLKKKYSEKMFVK